MSIGHKLITIQYYVIFQSYIISYFPSLQPFCSARLWKLESFFCNLENFLTLLSIDLFSNQSGQAYHTYQLQYLLTSTNRNYTVSPIWHASSLPIYLPTYLGLWVNIKGNITFLSPSASSASKWLLWSTSGLRGGNMMSPKEEDRY